MQTEIVSCYWQSNAYTFFHAQASTTSSSD